MECQETESRIQQEIVKHYRNNYCLAHHSPRCLIMSIPNDAARTRATQYAQTGMYTGAADLLIMHWAAGGKLRTIFAETKTDKGRLDPAQVRFRDHVLSMGLEYYVLRSVEDLKSIVNNGI